MKLEDIQVGGFYTDNKQGVREVLEIGPQLRTFGSDPDAVGVRYRILAATKQPDIGAICEVELKSLASWAKSKISKIETKAFVTQQSAARIHKHLSGPQRAFLASIDSDCGPRTYVECDRRELRVAKACFEKGLLEGEPDPGHADRQFDVRLTSLGLAVLKMVHNEAQA